MVTRDEMLAGLNLSGVQTPPRRIGRAEMLAGLQLGSQQPQPAAPFTSEQLEIFRGAHPPERENPFDFAGPLGDFIALIDKPRAIIGSTIKEIGDIFVPGESVSARDWWKQVEGNYLWGEYLQDWGVDLPGPLDFAAGITLDIATDPLTYMFGLGAWARMFKHGFHWERGALAMSGVAGKFDDAAAAALKTGNVAEETAAKATAAMLRDSATKVVDAKALSAAPREALEAIGLQKGLGGFVPGTGRLGRFFGADQLWDAVTKGAITAKRAKQASRIPVSEAIWGTTGNPKVIQHLKEGGSLADDFVRETTENVFTKRPWNYTVEQITERMRLLKAGGLVGDLDDPLLTVIARKAMVSPVELLSGPAWTGKVVGAVGSAPGKMARSMWRRPVKGQAQLSFGEQLDKAFDTRQPIKSLLRNGNQQVQLYGLELNAAVNDGWRAKSTLLGVFAPKVQRQRRIARDLGMTSEDANAFMQMDFRGLDESGELFDLTLGRQTRPLEDMIDPIFRDPSTVEGARWSKYVNDPKKLELWAENRQWWDDIQVLANQLPGAEQTPWLRRLLDDVYVARMLHPEFQSGRVNTVRIPGQGGPRPTRARDYVGGRDKFRGVELLRQQDHPKQLSVVEQMREITVAQLGDKAQELFEGDLWQIMDRYMHVISDEVKRQTTMYSLEGRGVAFRTPQSWMQSENEILQNALYDLTGKRERIFDDMFDAIDEGLNPELAAQARAAQLIEEGGTVLEAELARLNVEQSLLEPELVRVYTALADNLDELRRTVKAGRAERGAVRDYLAKFAREASALGKRREEIKQTLAAVQLERTRQGGTPIGDQLVKELESNLQAMDDHLRVAMFEATELSEYSDEVEAASEIWRVLTGGYEGHDWGVLDKALQPWARRVDDLREVMDDVDYQTLEPITMEQLPRWMSQVQDDGAAVGEYFRRMKMRHATPRLQTLDEVSGEMAEFAVTGNMPLTPVERSLSFGGRPQRMTTIYDIYGGPVVGDVAGPRPFRPPPKGDPPPYSPTGVEPPPVGGGAIGEPPTRRPGRLWDEPTTVAEATTQSLASSSRELDYPVQTPRVALSEAMDVAFEEIDIIRLEAGQRGAAVFTDPLDARVGEMLDAGVLRVGGAEAAEQVLEFYPRSYDDYLSLRAWVRGKGVPVLTPEGVQEPMYALLDTSELLLVNRFGDLAGDELRWLRASIDDGDITIGQLTSQQAAHRSLRVVEGEGPLLRAVDPRRPTLREAIDLHVELPFPQRGGRPGGGRPGGPSLRAIEGGGLGGGPKGVLLSTDEPMLRDRIAKWEAAQQELLDVITKRGSGGRIVSIHPSQLDDELHEIMNRIDRLRWEIDRLWTPPSGGAEVGAGAQLKWSEGKKLGFRYGKGTTETGTAGPGKIGEELLAQIAAYTEKFTPPTLVRGGKSLNDTPEGRALQAAWDAYVPKVREKAVFTDPPMGHSAHVRAANGQDVDVWFIERISGNWLVTVNGREVGWKPKLKEAKAFAQEQYAAGAGPLHSMAPRSTRGVRSELATRRAAAAEAVTPAARVAAEEVKAVPYQIFDGHVTGTPQTLDDVRAANPNMTDADLREVLEADYRLAPDPASNEAGRINLLLDELEPVGMGDIDLKARILATADPHERMVLIREQMELEGYPHPPDWPISETARRRRLTDTDPRVLQVKAWIPSYEKTLPELKGWNQVRADRASDAESYLAGTSHGWLPHLDGGTTAGRKIGEHGRLGDSEAQVLAWVEAAYPLGKGTGQGGADIGAPVTFAASKSWDATAQAKHAKKLKAYLDGMHRHLGGIDDTAEAVMEAPAAAVAAADEMITVRVGNQFADWAEGWLNINDLVVARSKQTSKLQLTREEWRRLVRDIADTIEGEGGSLDEAIGHRAAAAIRKQIPNLDEVVEEAVETPGEAMVRSALEASAREKTFEDPFPAGVIVQPWLNAEMKGNIRGRTMWGEVLAIDETGNRALIRPSDEHGRRISNEFGLPGDDVYVVKRNADGLWGMGKDRPRRAQRKVAPDKVAEAILADRAAWEKKGFRFVGEYAEEAVEAVEAPAAESLTRAVDGGIPGVPAKAERYAEMMFGAKTMSNQTVRKMLSQDYGLADEQIEALAQKYASAVDEAVVAALARRAVSAVDEAVEAPGAGLWVDEGTPAQVAAEADWTTNRSVPAPRDVEPPKPPTGPRVIRGADGEPLEQFVVGTPYGDFVIGRRLGHVKITGKPEFKGQRGARGFLPISQSGRSYEIIDVPFEVPRYGDPGQVMRGFGDEPLDPNVFESLGGQGLPVRGSYRGMVPEGPSSQRLLGAGHERGETIDNLLARIERWAEARFAEQQVPLAKLETVDNPRMRAILEELTGYTREGGPATGRLPSNMVMGAHLADEGPMPAASMVERAFLTQEATGQFAAAAQLSEEGATLSAEIALMEGRMHQLASQMITRRGAINTDAYQAYIKRFEEERTVRGFQEAVFDGASSQFNGAVPFWGEGWDIAGSAETRLATWNALVELHAAAVGPKNFPTFLKNYDKFLNYWKAQAVSTPGFIIRNMIGGTWINYAVGGVDFGTMHEFTGMYWKALRRGQGDAKEGIRIILDEAKQGKVKSINVGLFGVKKASLADWEIMQQVFEGGVFSGGQVITEVERGLARRGVASFTPGERTGKALPVKPGQSIDVVWDPTSVEFVPFRAVRTMNEQAEVVMRGTLAFDTLKKGGSLTDAVDNVFRLHFNYADLTRFERQVARRMIPFWKWQRSVLPLMAESVGRNPTAWTRLFQLKGEMELTSDPERNAVPDYYLEQLGMRLPWKINGNQTYWVPDFPFKDFLRLGKDPQDLVRMFAESAGPPVKLPLEIWAKKQFFADIPFSGRFQQVPPVYRNIPFLMEGLSLVGKAEKNRKGEWKMRDHDIYNMESWVPFLARFRRLFPDEDRYKRRQVSTFLSVVFGTQVRINDKYEQRNQMLRNDRAFAKTWQDIYDLELRTL